MRHIVTVEKFRNVVEREGLEYTLTGYYSRQFLETINDENIRITALMAHDALLELEKQLEPDYL